MTMTGKQAYKRWIKRRDKYWKTNYPRWKNLPERHRKIWKEVAQIFNG